MNQPAAKPTVEMVSVEVAHEALIRTWPRLRNWINTNREKLRARAAIVQAKAMWEEQGQRQDLLLPSGFQLERARELVADPGDITIEDIKAFIAESEAAEEQRRAEGLEASRRLVRRTFAGLVAALLRTGKAPTRRAKRKVASFVRPERPLRDKVTLIAPHHKTRIGCSQGLREYHAGAGACDPIHGPEVHSSVHTRYCPKDDLEDATPYLDFRFFAAGAGAAAATGGGST
jgi:hypothetical protein